MKVEVLFSPAEYANLSSRDLSQTSCVVFDILRATTTMISAFASGAVEIIPVSEIEEAMALRERDPKILLAGERGGLRIEGFDLGNSPREFTPEKVSGRRITITTTNGTRALKACAQAAEIHVGSFLNLSVAAQAAVASRLKELLIICAGTTDEASLEDTLAAGALCELVGGDFRDSAQIARATYRLHQSNLHAAFAMARNGRKLLSLPDLAADVDVCLRRDSIQIAAQLFRDGAIRRC